MAYRVAILLPDSPAPMTPADPAFRFDVSEHSVAEWVYAYGRTAGLGTDTMPGSEALYLPLVASQAPSASSASNRRRRPTRPSRRSSCTTSRPGGQVSLAIERAKLVQESQKARVQIEAERTRNALLSSISHDLRTPLAAITGAAGTLMEDAEGPHRELLR